MIGLRVVRGPGWSWDEQDGGEGHVGTVVEVEGPKLAKGTVIVQWDCGKRTNYCIGYKEVYDLLVLDSAPAGIKHTTNRCDGCGKEVIRGTRWKCRQCEDFDLCTPCYMSDKHDKRHAFYRFDTDVSAGTIVPPRCDSNVSLESRGFYSDAQVVRGYNWEWKDQDGKSTGKIIDIRDMGETSGRSVAKVLWDNGNSNIYRIGHNGKVDLKCVIPGRGFLYYRSHLQICGKQARPHSSKPSSNTVFSQGDRVVVNLGEKILKEMQTEHGGWNPIMAKVIGKTGVVHRMTDAGDVRVQFDRRHLEGAGRGKIQTKWTFHPDALELISKGASNDHEFSSLTSDSSLRSIDSFPSAKFEEELLRTRNSFGNADYRLADRLEELMRYVQLGSLDDVKQIMSSSPVLATRLNETNERFPLHAAAASGHRDIVNFLHESGVDCDKKDNGGDTALHHAVSGKHLHVVNLLVTKCGVKLNVKGRRGSTPLHLAVFEGLFEVTKLLLDNCADVNSQDINCNTVMHCSLKRPNNHSITQLVSNQSTINLLLRNNNGHNPFHTAVTLGDFRSVETILGSHPSIVNSSTSFQQHALHLAAESSSDCADMIRFLVTKKCDLNGINALGETPLYLVCRRGLMDCMEALVDGGADVNLSVGRKSCIEAAFKSPSTSQAVIISGTNNYWTKIKHIASKHRVKLSPPFLMSAYLVIHGANLPAQVPSEWISCLGECRDVCSSTDERMETSEETSLEELKAELKRKEEEKLCPVCFDKRRDVALLPCGHMFCTECSEKLLECSLCRGPKQGVLKCFI